jgi:hypothetical protein
LDYTSTLNPALKKEINYVLAIFTIQHHRYCLHSSRCTLCLGIENQKRRERQRLEMQKDSYNNRKESDIYLRREIELLALEKQRMELQLAIKDARKQRY